MIPVFFDIETIPDQTPGAMDRAADEAKPPGNMSKPDTIEKWRMDNAADLWLRTALDGSHGEIVSIAWKRTGVPVRSLCRGQEKNGERQLITRFLNDLEDVQRQLRWCGHCVDFDLKFLWQRMIVLDVRSPLLIPRHRRAWHPEIWDSAYEWSGKEHGIKLKTLCNILGLEHDAGDIDGRGVWEAWRDGDVDAIMRHNVADVLRVEQLFKRMTGWSLEVLDGSR